MNIIINSSCNKGCPYCFAHKQREEHEFGDMTFDRFKDILDFNVRNEPIKLLGGEPTIHPQFIEFMEYAFTKSVKIIVISNFLFDDKVRDFLVKSVQQHDIGFLINSTNLDVYNRLEKFKKNYNAVYEAMYALDREEEISCGITFENIDFDYYGKYLDFLKANLDNVERLRMSINFPSSAEDRDKFDFIDNYAYGDLFVNMINKCLSYGITPGVDCTLFPCIFRNKELYKYVRKFTGFNNFNCDSGGSCPGDIFPDKSMSFCYPMRDNLKIDDYTQYKNYGEATGVLAVKYKILNSITDRPEKCYKCPFFLQKICTGPSLCFYNI